MSIKSHAFGRVTLTGADARKFKNQIIHGKPKPVAAKSVRRGVALSRALQKSGQLVVIAKVKN
jgi:hypothetical protein